MIMIRSSDPLPYPLSQLLCIFFIVSLNPIRYLFWLLLSYPLCIPLYRTSLFLLCTLYTAYILFPFVYRYSFELNFNYLSLWLSILPILLVLFVVSAFVIPLVPLHSPLCDEVPPYGWRLHRIVLQAFLLLLIPQSYPLSFQSSLSYSFSYQPPNGLQRYNTRKSSNCVSGFILIWILTSSSSHSPSMIRVSPKRRWDFNWIPHPSQLKRVRAIISFSAIPFNPIKNPSISIRKLSLTSFISCIWIYIHVQFFYYTFITPYILPYTLRAWWPLSKIFPLRPEHRFTDMRI